MARLGRVPQGGSGAPDSGGGNASMTVAGRGARRGYSGRGDVAMAWPPRAGGCMFALPLKGVCIKNIFYFEILRHQI